MRQGDERGSVTVWGVLIALILTLVIGITVDLTGQVNAQQRAHDLAQQAGRTAANQVQASQIMRGQSPQIDTAAARMAAAAYLHAAGVEGSVSITGPTTLSGRPGSASSDSSTVQFTVAATLAGVPTGLAKPAVSRVTVIDAHVSPWLARVARAAATADVWAAPAVRALDAARAASAAACCTLPWAIATRPPATANISRSMSAGTNRTSSIAADPRSSAAVFQLRALRLELPQRRDS